MASKMDQSLDEILAEKTKDRSQNRRGNRNGPRQTRRDDGPRDGIRKSYRDEGRNLDSEWVHDRYEAHEESRRPAPRRRRDSPPNEGATRGSKLRVDNIHYDLTQDDLQELFTRIGPIVKLDLRYDRAGRSEGTAFVTYEAPDDAARAIKEFDGANANGQPIRLTIMAAPRARNPFDSAVMPGRPLAERITVPSGRDRARSLSPDRRPAYDEEDARKKGIDRYVPGGGGDGGRSRSPLPRRQRGGGGGPGRRPGARRDGGGRGDREDGGGGRGGSRRPRKTQEELDAEMEDYFGSGGAGNGGAIAAEPAANGPAGHLFDDTDMIA